jgi:hypothetical protein
VIFRAIFDRGWRTVAALDRVLARPNAIEDLAITGFELSRAAWWRANSSVWRFQTLRTLGRERLAVELQGFACVSILLQFFHARLALQSGHCHLFLP